MGQKDMRRLLVIGAMSVTKAALNKGVPEDSWLGRLLARKSRMVADVALANKMARMIWAELIIKVAYRGPEAGVATLAKSFGATECEEDLNCIGK